MPDYSEVLKQLYDILGTYIKDTSKLSQESKLVDEYGMTSLQVMQMIADIEDEFDISIPLNVLPNITTVGDLAREIETLLD